MTGLAAGLGLLLHAALVGSAPLLAGAMARLHAVLLGRRGPPLLATYESLWRGARKQAPTAESATIVQRGAPWVVLGAVVGAALLVPSFTLGMASAPLADLLTVLGLLALARGALVLAALDLGDPLGGLGAARSTTQGALAVPALVAIALALALLTGSTNLDRVLGVLRDGPVGARVPAAIGLGAAIAALVPVAAVLAGRRRSDRADPLTLDYGGVERAVLDYAGAVQTLVWLSLVGALAFPAGLASPSADGVTLSGWAVGLLAWLARTAVLAAALVAWETIAERLTAAVVPVLLGTASLLASLSVLVLLAAQAAP